MDQVKDYKVYGYNDGWQIIATLYNEEQVRPYIDSLEDFSQVMVIVNDYLNNQDEPYLIEDIEKNYGRRRNKWQKSKFSKFLK